MSPSAAIETSEVVVDLFGNKPPEIDWWGSIPKTQPAADVYIQSYLTDRYKEEDGLGKVAGNLTKENAARDFIHWRCLDQRPGNLAVWLAQNNLKVRNQKSQTRVMRDPALTALIKHLYADRPDRSPDRVSEAVERLLALKVVLSDAHRSRTNWTYGDAEFVFGFIKKRDFESLKEDAAAIIASQAGKKNKKKKKKNERSPQEISRRAVLLVDNVRSAARRDQLRYVC